MRVLSALGAGLIAAGAAGGAAALWAAPQASDTGAGHPPPDASHAAFLRRVRSGAAIAPGENPGVRVYPGVLGVREAGALLSELQPLKAAYGISLISPAAAAIYRFQMSYLGKGAPPVNMLRITGRPEQEGQQQPPWRYGNTFDESALPPRLRELAGRLRALPGMRLGRLRDVTINHRRGWFYRLDPHVDPAADGETVIIVSVDAGTVLTLCPQRWLQLQKAWDWVVSAATLEDERALIQRQAEGSWTGRDIDVRADARSAVALSGDARWTWTHGTRLGVPLSGEQGLHDWWGSRDDVLRRGPERHSVVFAFAAAEEESGGGGGSGA